MTIHQIKEASRLLSEIIKLGCFDVQVESIDDDVAPCIPIDGGRMVFDHPFDRLYGDTEFFKEFPQFKVTITLKPNN